MTMTLDRAARMRPARLDRWFLAQLDAGRIGELRICALLDADRAASEPPDHPEPGREREGPPPAAPDTASSGVGSTGPPQKRHRPPSGKTGRAAGHKLEIIITRAGAHRTAPGPAAQSRSRRP